MEQTATHSGAAAYRFRPPLPEAPRYIWDMLGDPPVLCGQLAQFWATFESLVKESPPQTLADWFNRWDQTVLRVEISQIGRAKSATVGLYYDRAAKEICRPGGLRFVDHDPYKEPIANFTRMAADVEADEATPDYDEMREELKRIGVEHISVSDVAYMMATPRLGPLEVCLALKYNQSRQLRDDDRRCREQASWTQAQSGAEDAIEGDFNSVATSDRKAAGETDVAVEQVTQPQPAPQSQAAPEQAASPEALTQADIQADSTPEAEATIVAPLPSEAIHPLPSQGLEPRADGSLF